MNEDAEAWICAAMAENGSADWSESEEIAAMYREAMRWAYADAAQLCQNESGNQEAAQERSGMLAAENCRELIEARAAIA